VDGVAHLCAAEDKDKDQSYFLFATTAEQLDFLRFPLGGMSKPEVRALAERFGLQVADKPDSQDICFVPNGRYADVIAKIRPNAAVAGDIVDLEGTVLGQHEGIINYTIGQRKGLKVGGLSTPVYVLRLDPDKNQVVVGPKEALMARAVYFKEANWIGQDVGDDGAEVSVKIRSTAKAVPGRIFLNSLGGGHVVLNEAEAGVSPGQACVAYEGDRVLGGGWIVGAEAAL
jgi:tRNA-specific 2-thiouridylase